MDTHKKGNVEWNLSHLIKNPGPESIIQNEKDVLEACEKFVKKWKNRKDYLESADSLKEALDDYERWLRFYGSSGNAGLYYWLKRTVEQNNPDVTASYNKLEELNTKVSNEIHFFELNIAKINPQLQKKMLADSTLKNYKHFLERIFLTSKYNLSEDQEKIITLLSSNAYTKWENMVSGFISKSEKEILTEDGKTKKSSFEETLKSISSKDKKVRDFAAEKLNEIIKENLDVAEVEMNAILSYKKMMSELRKYERIDKERHVEDDIDSEIVDQVIESVSKRNDIAARYYSLKAKLLGVDKLKYHERNVEYGNINKKYPYDESIELVKKVFGNLDKEFAEHLNSFVKEGRIDVYPRTGKTGGAFCAHELISQPVYVLLNHTDKLDDVCTIAHELGHGLNYEFMKRKQNAINFGTNLATAEVASTFMEDFVLEEILKTADDELKLTIMLMKMEDYINSIIRQAACYKFELELHSEFAKKGYLSKDEIGTIFQKNMSNYMGESVEQTNDSKNWWVYWSHIRTGFYVYSYVSGRLISKYMQSEVKKDKKFVLKVKEFLSTGLVDSTKNIFLKMGIDITKKEFWEEGLKEIDDLLIETENLAEKLGKI